MIKFHKISLRKRYYEKSCVSSPVGIGVIEPSQMEVLATTDQHDSIESISWSSVSNLNASFCQIYRYSAVLVRGVL